ncbi:MAG TPA: zinc-dependent alcohol dehydrogenase [Nitrospira sp.]|nr:zinc-dependent alcohol dehydrogenase [Nitrospira sp.]
MKAVVFHAVGDIRVDDVPDPQLQAPTDAIVRITASAICGTDLHMVRGTLPGMKSGTILGHEAVGVVQEIGRDVRNFKPGDRVVVPSTIACGYCVYCRAGYHSQCDNANPNGPSAGSCFFGGPAQTGPINGLQAEYARIPFANAGLVKLPDDLDDNRAIMLSDIFPTGYFGADIAEIKPGDTVAVFGCGPVGQFTIASAKLMDAGRIFAVDCIPSRLDMAREQGAEVIDFNGEDPLEAIKSLTGGIGVDRAIDAVGVDSMTAKQGPAAKEAEQMTRQFRQEVQQIASDTNPQGDNWHPGDAPSQAITWAVKALAKAGTLSVIGVYPQTDRFFPLGTAMNKNLSLHMGNCNHRKYVPLLIDIVRSGKVDPAKVLTQVEPLSAARDAYRAFDSRQPGWIKVELKPDVAMAAA